MKILVGYINDNKVNGIDKYIMRFSKAIKKEDVQIDYLTKFDENDFHRELKKQGHKVFKVSRNRHFFKAIKETEKIIKENNYDIVYINVSESFDCTALIAANRLKVKKRIIHSHNSSKTTSNPLKTLFIRIMQSLFKPVVYHNANQYIACSKLAAQWMFTKRVYDLEEYEIINNSIDDKKFKFNKTNRDKIRKKYNIEDKYVIGFIGRFSKEKNNIFQVDILKEVIKTRDAVLVCVGNGAQTEKDKFIDYVKKQNLEDRVIMTGAVDNPEVYYSAFDVFILPSIYEGFPIVGVEAQFNNVPCIFSENITSDIILGENSYQESINSPLPWANRINTLEKRNNKLNNVAEGFKVENDNFDILLNKNKIDKNTKLPVQLLFYVLAIHYLINLTNVLNGINFLVFPCFIIFAMLGINHLKCYKEALKSKTVFLLILFVIDYIVSFLINTKYNVIGTAKTLIWILIYFFALFYPYNRTNKKEIVYYAKKLFSFIISIFALFALVNFGLLLYNVETIQKVVNGTNAIIGYAKWDRFYGIFYDANYASVISGSCIMMAIYLYKFTKRNAEKILLLLSILLQAIYILAGQSRSGLLSTTIGLIIYLILNLIAHRKAINSKIFIKNIAILAVCILVIFFSYKGIVALSGRYSRNTETTTPSSSIIDKTIPEEKKEEKKNQVIDNIFNRADVKNSTDISNRRFDIWKSGLNIYRRNLIFGIGANNAVEYAKDKMPSTYIVNNDFNIFNVFHNVIIDVMVFQGSIGLTIFGFLVINIAMLTIKWFWFLINSKYNSLFIVLVSCLITITVSSMFLSEIIYVNNACTYLFWVALGYYYVLLNNKTKEKENEKDSSRSGNL